MKTIYYFYDIICKQLMFIKVYVLDTLQSLYLENIADLFILLLIVSKNHTKREKLNLDQSIMTMRSISDSLLV